MTRIWPVCWPTHRSPLGAKARTTGLCMVASTVWVKPCGRSTRSATEAPAIAGWIIPDCEPLTEAELFKVVPAAAVTGPAIVTVQDWPLPNDGVVHLTWAPCCVQVPIVLVTV